MSTEKYDQLLAAVHAISEFAEGIGATDQAKSFRKLHERLQAGDRPSKGLEEDIFHARGLASFWIPSHISKQRWNAAKKERVGQEFTSLRQSLDDALMP